MDETHGVPGPKGRSRKGGGDAVGSFASGARQGGAATPPAPQRQCCLIEATGALTAGTDEAGRGCLAGPVVAAAVILPPAFDLPGLADSKKLTEARRYALRPAILSQAVAWNLGLVWPWTIDRINILQASLAAMRGAILRLGVRPGLVLVDGNRPIPDLGAPQRTVVHGDALEPAISAASILAKTFRDDIMRRLDARYPVYGFAGHKGYGAEAHMAALRAHGPCRMHRMTFRGVLSGQDAAARETVLCLPGI